MTRLWNCILNKQSPRYFEWWHILEQDEVPVISPLPLLGLPEPDQKVDVYRLDVDALTPSQLERLIDFVDAKYKVGRELVLDELQTTGFPIRTEDVVVFYSHRAFI